MTRVRQNEQRRSLCWCAAPKPHGGKRTLTSRSHTSDSCVHEMAALALKASLLPLPKFDLRIFLFFSETWKAADHMLRWTTPPGATGTEFGTFWSPHGLQSAGYWDIERMHRPCTCSELSIRSQKATPWGVLPGSFTCHPGTKLPIRHLVSNFEATVAAPPTLL